MLTAPSQDVSRQECRPVTKEVCTKVTNQVPKEECRKVPREVCEQVDKLLSIKHLNILSRIIIFSKGSR